ncbi:MAG: efflux RND transporter periplasmic adaptor subunit [Alphaproteobacteria bacterium]|nr:efflux RND transporter periplasmic adaptor subunit [Alphaproteobacteria bacterium]
MLARWRRLDRRLRLAGIGGAIVLTLAIVWLATRGGSSKDEFRLANVDRGEIVSAISTSGKIGAVVTVEISSQISGQVSEIHVDFNSLVKKNQLLARIDPQTFEARVRQAEAEVAVTKANLAMQRAALLRARADQRTASANFDNARTRAVDAERELRRREELIQRGVASTRDVERARTDMESTSAQTNAAQATVGSSEAQIAVAEAQVINATAAVQKAEAALEQALIDLERTHIRAPVEGTVINRAVNLGQTVAASLNAPVLFVIAQDLREMQVETNVDEADIGRVRVGQPVNFTVDAFTGRTFAGKVEQIRQLPIVASNVTTYTVVVSADNRDQVLLPGLTANVQIILDRRTDVVRVPNLALRYRPPDQAAAGPGAQAASPTPPPGAPPGAGRPPGNAPAPGELLQRLTEQLQLTQDQQRRAQAFGGETRDVLQRLRTSGASREEMQTELRRAGERFNEQLRTILTEGQRAKFAEILAQRQGGSGAPGRVWVVGENGKPKALTVRLGITNGNHTELLGGEIEPGASLIVGNNQAVRRTTGITGFRL